jgi:hypothetical protein
MQLRAPRRPPCSGTEMSRRLAMQRRAFDPPAALMLALLALGACKHKSAGTAGDLGRTSASSAPVQPSPAGATGPVVDSSRGDSSRGDSSRGDSAGGQLALPPSVGATPMQLPSIGATVLVPAPATGATSLAPAAGSGVITFPESTLMPRVDSLARPRARPDTIRPLFPRPIPGPPGTRLPGFDTSTTPLAPFPHPDRRGSP